MTIHVIKYNKLMKTIILIFAIGALAAQTVQAQGTTYMSDLAQSSSGSNPIGSDSWFATGFGIGNNANGYTLNSIQLPMTGATGNPSGLTVMIYALLSGGAGSNGRGVYNSPGTILGTLNGSSDPETGGIYTYTPASSLTLLPGIAYFIVLTSGTTVATGAYEWSFCNSFSFNTVGGWGEAIGPAGAEFQSSDGSSWSYSYPTSGHAWQFAINATAVPEPSPVSLIFLGSGILLYVSRRK
jgi:hypothetical protein